ncbi:MAG: RidA family protein [Deltaproteobacteria bacterium]|nr:RidA family protein [Deltaproteobacteria bacterium]
MKEIKTKAAPAAIGPYSQGVKYGDLIFVSGQIPLNPESGVVVGDDITTQTRQVLENLSEVLKAAGTDTGGVIKTTVYLTDLTTFTEMNEVYGEFFEPPYPARATVEVGALPKGVMVEIDAVAKAG